MLRIYFGSHKDEIYNTDLYFRNVYSDEWLKDSFVQKMIHDIDDSEVLENSVIKNTILGNFAPIGLSGGVKTLILIYKQPNKIFNISTCGENCIPLLFEIAAQREKKTLSHPNITVCLHHAMKLPVGEKVKVINDNKRTIVSDPEAFLLLADQYLKGEKNAR